MVSRGELLSNITEYILLYKQSDDYVKRILLGIKEEVFIYVNNKSIGLIGFDYTPEMHDFIMEYNDFDSLNTSLESDNFIIPIHITTEFFKNKIVYDFGNLDTQFRYFLDELGDSWVNDKNNLIVKNLLQALEKGLIINCVLDNLILKEFIENHHKTSLYKYSISIEKSKLVCNSSILTLYSNNKEYLKNNILSLDSGLCINVCNINRYLNIDVKYDIGESILAFKLDRMIIQDINELDSYIDDLELYLKKNPNILINGILINGDMYIYNNLNDCIIYILDKCNKLIESNILKYNDRIKVNFKYFSFNAFYRRKDLYNMVSSIKNKYIVYDFSLINDILK